MTYKARHATPGLGAKTSRGARVAAVSAAAVGAAGAVAIGAAPAGASTPVVTATTYVANNPDSGDNGTWAYDDLHRTLVITPAGTTACDSLSGFSATTDACYNSTVTDNGRFNTIPGAAYPNGAITGEISHAITGTMTGSASYTFYAPSADVPSAANVLSYLDDDFSVPTAPADLLGTWYLQAFPPSEQADVYQGGLLNNWIWTYTDACTEKWVDSADDNAGDGVADGNITGDTCITSQSATGQVENVNSGKCLDVTNGNFAGGLQQYTCGASFDGVKGADQKFRIVTRSDGTSALQAVAPDGTAYYVTSSTRGAQLVLRPYYSSGADMVRSGSFYTFPKTGLVADVTARSRENNAVVQGWNDNGGTNQQWSMP
jgi:hypothetical protein